MTRAITTLTGLLLMLAPAVGAAENAALDRYILAIGANDGGDDRVKLRYATKDAEGFAEVMGEYGGVEPERLLLVLDPDRAAVDAAFAELHARVGQSSGRTEVMVFYSGHADEKGLLLGGEQLSYADLRAHLKAMPADVHIAIVDACASGALTRAKGGTRQPPFLIDQASRVTGHAYLASASADEAAQESDRLGASFFSHALLTGLRGAADVSADGVVTLGEAYQFAFRETLSRTEGTRLGAQHASYDMQLVGSGDVVLTDLRKTSAGLFLEDTIAGRVFVRDADGRLIAELDKAAGQPIRLGLAPGGYRMRIETRSGRHLAGAVALAEGRTTRVDLGAMSPVETEVAVARGSAPAPPDSQIAISLVPGLSTDGGKRRRISINLFAGQSEGVTQFEIGGFNLVDGDVRVAQIGAVGNAVEGTVQGFQLAGVLNYAEAMRGTQVTGALGIAGELHGTQVAGALGVADDVNGFQASGAISVADDVRGVQFGGVLAVADDVRGVQGGLISVADTVTGVQLGLITVADEVDGLALALIPYVRNGRHHIEVFSSELAWLNVGGRLGGGAFHTLLSAGYQQDRHRIVASAGFGGEVIGELFEFDFDLVATAVADERELEAKPDFMASARIIAGVRLAKHLALFAGGSWTVAANPRPFDPGFTPLVQVTPDPSLYLDMWPGAVAGLRF